MLRSLTELVNYIQSDGFILVKIFDIIDNPTTSEEEKKTSLSHFLELPSAIELTLIKTEEGTGLELSATETTQTDTSLSEIKKTFRMTTF